MGKILNFFKKISIFHTHLMPHRKLKSHVKMRKRDIIDTTKYSSSHVTKINPSINWFGNTRSINQNQLQELQKKYEANLNDPFSFIVTSKKLPRSLLETPEFKNSINVNKDFGIVPGKLKKHQLTNSLKANSLEEFMATDSPSINSNNKNKTCKTNKAVDFGNIDNINKFTKIGRSDRIRGEVLKLIDCSDVIINVLDARDPQGTIVSSYENLIKKNYKKKKIMYVLNKVDLVPKQTIIEWMKVLSKKAPVVAFSCCNKKHNYNKDFGVGAVRKLLSQMKSLLSETGRDWMSVGILGYPNVGKSSFINAMRKKKVCTSAPKAGETIENKYVLLEKEIYLIDSPGIVAPQPGETKQDLVLRGVCRNETIDEPERYIKYILSRIDKNVLVEVYDLKTNEWENEEKFIELVGRRRKRILKGDKVDINTVCKNIISDWNRGRLPWHNSPK
eukprot:GAHX01000158.1.p1 GENE.GAHX01000158.1~~GAHX01000158.1.p1  ORF type:complete len:446 (-),score=83.13 GAHX01000158.1:27-1364(-)